MERYNMEIYGIKKLYIHECYALSDDERTLTEPLAMMKILSSDKNRGDWLWQK